MSAGMVEIQNTVEGKTINTQHKTFVVLKYMLLGIKFRIKSWHAVHVFYKSKNC